MATKKTKTMKDVAVLETMTTQQNVVVSDANGNVNTVTPGALAQVAAELMPQVSDESAGLYPSNLYRIYRPYGLMNLPMNKFAKLFKLHQYAFVVVLIEIGPVHIPNMMNVSMLLLNNRSQGSLSIPLKKMFDSGQDAIYAKYDSTDNSADIYLKTPNENYMSSHFSILIADNPITIYNTIDDSVTEGDLTKISL